MSVMQFYGSDAVIRVFENRGLDTWSVWQGKNLMGAGQGAAELQAFMDMLGDYSAGAVFTLKVYAKGTKDDIDERTAANGSFNFKLTDQDSPVIRGMGLQTSPQRSGSLDSIISSRIGSALKGDIEQMIDERLSRPPKEEKIGWLDKLAKPYIENPKELIGLIGSLRQAFGTPVMQAAPRMTGIKPRVMHSEPQQQAEATTQKAAAPADKKVSGKKEGSFTEDDYDRMYDAVDRISEVDPDIVTHLEKLADLAENDQDTFNFIIKKMDAL